MTELRKFIIYTAKAVMIILIIDYVLGTGMSTLYGKMKVGERARADFAINKSTADLYIFGASRALYQYNPSILRDTLHMSVYNAGRSAQTILYHLAVFKMLLKRHHPKMVIVDINPQEFSKGPDRYDLINSLLPYYQSSEEVRKVVDLVKPGYRYFKWSHILPYNSSIFAILYRSLFSKGKNNDDNGYIFLTGHKLRTPERFHNCKDNIEYDPVLLDAFYEFVRLCRENNIRLLMVTSPYFSIPDCPRKDFKRVKAEITHLNIDYVDFFDNKKYLENLDYMYDVGHLNYQGSVAFTTDLASYIKEEQARRQ